MAGQKHLHIICKKYGCKSNAWKLISTSEDLSLQAVFLPKVAQVITYQNLGQFTGLLKKGVKLQEILCWRPNTTIVKIICIWVVFDKTVCVNTKIYHKKLSILIPLRIGSHRIICWNHAWEWGMYIWWRNSFYYSVPQMNVHICSII